MRTTLVVCVIAASALAGPPAWAALHTPADHNLDQFQENQNYGYAVGGPTLMGQTFTVDKPGLLCHIEIGNTSGKYWGNFSGAPAAPVVEIRGTTGDGRPSEDILGSVPLSDPVPIDGWTLPIDFMPYNIQVAPGEMYSIVLWAENHTGAVSVGATADPTFYTDAGPAQDDYEGGELWTYTYDDYDNLTWLDDAGLYDMQFRTYVVPVPLPAGVWLGIFAVSVAGWHLKRQRV